MASSVEVWFTAFSGYPQIHKFSALWLPGAGWVGEPSNRKDPHDRKPRPRNHHDKGPVMSKKTMTSGFNEPNKPKKFVTIRANEQFDPQHTPSSLLPDPRVFSLNVTHRALEVLTGSRDLAQIGRWVTEEVYHSLNERVNQRILTLSLLPLEQRRQPAPVFTLFSPMLKTPRDGVVEGNVLVRSAYRVRAVALRLEGFDYRWRVASFTLI